MRFHRYHRDNQCLNFSVFVMVMFFLPDVFTIWENFLFLLRLLFCHEGLDSFFTSHEELLWIRHWRPREVIANMEQRYKPFLKLERSHSLPGSWELNGIQQLCFPECSCRRCSALLWLLCTGWAASYDNHSSSLVFFGFSTETANKTDSVFYYVDRLSPEVSAAVTQPILSGLQIPHCKKPPESHSQRQSRQHAHGAYLGSSELWLPTGAHSPGVSQWDKQAILAAFCLLLLKKILCTDVQIKCWNYNFSRSEQPLCLLLQWPCQKTWSSETSFGEKWCIAFLDVSIC